MPDQLLIISPQCLKQTSTPFFSLCFGRSISFVLAFLYNLPSNKDQILTNQSSLNHKYLDLEKLSSSDCWFSHKDSSLLFFISSFFNGLCDLLTVSVYRKTVYVKLWLKAFRDVHYFNVDFKYSIAINSKFISYFPSIQSQRYPQVGFGCCWLILTIEADGIRLRGQP